MPRWGKVIKSLRDKYQHEVKHNNTSGNDTIEIDERLVEAFEPEMPVLNARPLNSSGKFYNVLDKGTVVPELH